MSESLPPESKHAGVSGDTDSFVKNPAFVVASTIKAGARILTISDQHITVLLPQDDSTKALLKLTLIPFYKKELASLPPVGLEEDNEAAAANEQQREQNAKDHSSKVLEFLSRFKWTLTSESGAEYSYHEACPKIPTVLRDTADSPVRKKAKTASDGDEPKDNNASVFKAELIYPASERQLSRAMPSSGLSLISETPTMYEAVTKPFIEETVASGSLSWLKNIVEVKKEKERLLWNAEGWILNIDTKWRSHPPPLEVPRSEFFKHDSIADLYCLGIFKQNGVASLRDLNGSHLLVLKEMLDKGPEIIEKVYGVPKDQLRIFVHYQPQFYHFHVHYTRLENEIGAQVEKAHLLSDIIQDLEADPECFQKKTLVYKLSHREKLYRLLKANEEENDNDEV